MMEKRDLVSAPCFDLVAFTSVLAMSTCQTKHHHLHKLVFKRIKKGADLVTFYDK
jgi:hypothetical protein